MRLPGPDFVYGRFYSRFVSSSGIFFITAVGQLEKYKKGDND